jgi:hypothetical protein
VNGLLDDAEIPVACPKCGYDTPLTIGWLKCNDRITCRCGHIIDFGAAAFQAGMAEVDRAFDELTREPDGPPERFDYVRRFVA